MVHPVKAPAAQPASSNSSWDSHGGRREPTPASRLLTSTPGPRHMHAFIHIYTINENLSERFSGSHCGPAPACNPSTEVGGDRRMARLLATCSAEKHEV